ncbi:MFS transporter [Pelagibacterium limicola]|uniref:MFS transporter n=1 Tax=Pelagibacterium limicola TaxID=2791022 RepID=UPI0018AFDF9C|nr:MFS transporter [Pelagibacterium limicola]
MTAASPARFASPEVRAGLYYLSFYVPAAVQTLLLPIWLDAQGIGEEQIGLIAAVPIAVMIVLNLLVGRIADKASDWRNVIVVASLIAAVASLGLAMVDSFWGILLIVSLCAIPMMATEPVIDAATMRMTRRRGSDFARVRIWGTVGFVAMSALAGWIYGWAGIAIFVPLFIATCLLRGGVALLLPRFRAPDGEAVAPVNIDAATTMRQVLRPWFVLALAGGAVLQASHMLLMSFGALLWVRAGVPESMLGILWSVAPVFELLVIFYFARIARRFSARHLLLFACICGVVRWTGMPLASELWQFAVLQSLHMATFALGYMGMVSFVANWTSEDIAAQAQSFYVVLKQVASVLALIAFGPLVAAMGMDSYYVAAGVAGLGGAMIVISLAMKKTK